MHQHRRNKIKGSDGQPQFLIIDHPQQATRCEGLRQRSGEWFRTHYQRQHGGVMFRCQCELLSLHYQRVVTIRLEQAEKTQHVEITHTRRKSHI
ncbi:MAG: hypothetical protein BWY63_02730 [Chloroflexi bacterium ADurb.Bin360]|nr:MAG: hypothetical protein BWY63_02730 [Chloroflexi bacterium ADurb.Bin360]